MRKLILLSLLFISTLLIGQSAIFSTTFSVGSFRDAASNTLGTPTAVTFAKTEKGLVASFNGSTSKVAITSTTYDVDGGTYTFEFWAKRENVALNTVILGESQSGYKNIRLTNDNRLFIESNTNGNQAYCTIVSDDTQWHHYIITCNAGTVAMYQDGVSLSITGTLSDNITLDRIGVAGTSLWFNGSIARIAIYPYVFNELQRNDSYTAFLNPPSLNQELTLISHPQQRDLSYIPNLVASYTFANPIKGELIDEAGTNNGTVVGGISTREGMNFSDAYIDYGAIGNVKTITFRINLQSTTENIFEGASNDLEVYANAGTLTYPDYDNAYINGIDTDVITTGWHTITVTSSTNVNLTAAKIGIINTTYGDFEIAENQFYSDEKGTTWIDAYHAKWEVVKKYIDFEFASVGLPAVGWQQGTGSYEVSESVTGLEHRKFLECTASGTTAFASSTAYGEWQWDMYKGADANTTYIPFISDGVLGGYENTGYVFLISGAEAIYFRSSIGGARSTLFNTSASYININTWYSIKITRTTDGTFTAYIKGGAFGDVFTLIVPISGSNPILDNTYKTSSWFVGDLDDGDLIDNIIIKEK